MSLEDTLRSWAGPPSDTEQEKADNAARIIRETLQAAPGLSQFSLRVFPQGSYNSNTNVRLDSDVDVCVLCTDQYYSDFSLSDLTRADLTDPRGTVDPANFRDAVETALVKRFGRDGVTPGNKAFDVHANSYRLDADVVVAFEHRRYARRALGGLSRWDEGIEFFPRKGSAIINWPRQTYDNGVAKNERTGKRYKAAIRIIKRARNAMQNDRIGAAANIGSFLIESLVWNVPDDYLQASDYKQMIRAVLAHTFNATLTDADCSEWGEVNELKYLFRSTQPWTRQQANQFLGAAWDYFGYK